MSQVDSRMLSAGEAFTPSTPIDKRDLFAGRREQVQEVLKALIMTGQHVAIYGERGVGKTSLASVIHDFLPSSSSIIPVRINCDGSTTFKSMFRNILEEIKLRTPLLGIGFRAQETVQTTSLDRYIAEDDINPNSLRFLFRQLSNKIIIIIDEFDRVTDLDVKRSLSDTIKNFSDYKVNVTLIVVGIAESVDELIAEHQSIARALVQVAMPRMKKDELSDIIDKGLRNLQITIQPKAKQQIVRLSQGLPHYTHLLAFHAVQSALQAKRDEITIDDVSKAITSAVRMRQQMMEESYSKAINSPRGNIYPQVLLACSMASRDERGYFPAATVKTALNHITGKSYEIAAFAQHLKQFCSAERGPVLKQTGYRRRYKYHFVDPLFEPYIIMRGLATGMITDADLDQ